MPLPVNCNLKGKNIGSVGANEIVQFLQKNFRFLVKIRIAKIQKTW